MNNRIAKFVALLLCVVMAATMFAACTGGGGSDEFPINYDIDLTQKPKLNVLMPNSGRDINAVNSDNNALLIQQLTGYEVEYTGFVKGTAENTANKFLDMLHTLHGTENSAAEGGAENG